MLGGIQGRWDTGKGKISKLEDVDNLKYLKRNTERKKDVLREKDTSELWDNVRGPDKWLRPVKGGGVRKTCEETSPDFPVFMEAVHS